MEDDDSAWGNAPDDFSVSVYHSKAPSFGRKSKASLPVVGRVNITRPPPTSNKGRILVPSKAAFPSTTFDTAFTIVEEEDPFQPSFRKIIEDAEVPEQIDQDDTVAAAARFHSSFGNINELALNDEFTEEENSGRDSRRDRSTKERRRGRSAGRLAEDKKERRRDRSSGPLEDTKNQASRERSRSRGPIDSSKKKSTSSRDRSRSRGPLDDSRKSSTRSHSSGPPEAATPSEGRRRARARSRDAATTSEESKASQRGKSPGALRRGTSPGRLRQIVTRERSKSPTRLQEGQSKPPGSLSRRASGTSHSTRKERTSSFMAPRRTKSLDMELKIDEEDHPKHASGRSMDQDAAKRASKRTMEDNSSKRSHQPSLDKTLGELPGETHRVRRDDKSTSSRSSGGTTTTNDSSKRPSSLDVKLKMTVPSSQRPSRRGQGSVVSDVAGNATESSRRSFGRKSHSTHSSSNSVGSGDSGERDVASESKEHRRKERVRSARERLKEEEAKIIRLQEEARLLEAKRLAEETRLEALREEARQIEQARIKEETGAHKTSVSKLAKKYGTASGDVSQLPPAFQMWPKK